MLPESDEAQLSPFALDIGENSWTGTLNKTPCGPGCTDFGDFQDAVVFTLAAGLQISSIRFDFDGSLGSDFSLGVLGCCDILSHQTILAHEEIEDVGFSVMDPQLPVPSGPLYKFEVNDDSDTLTEIYTVTLVVTAVPEPTIGLLVGLGLIALDSLRQRWNS